MSAVTYLIAAVIFAAGAVLVGAPYRPGIPAELIDPEPADVESAAVIFA